jgi:hypothetical protein
MIAAGSPSGSLGGAVINDGFTAFNRDQRKSLTGRVREFDVVSS